MARPATLIIIVIAIILAASSMFIVDEGEYGIKFQLGKIVRTDYEPGLHFKLPFINNVRKLNRRILTLDAEPERFPTSEKKFVIVDSFVKWRINDVEQFYIRFQGDEFRARSRLSQIMKDLLRAEFAKRTLREVVAAERGELADQLLVANNTVDDFGIELVDVRLKRVELPDDVSGSVFDRMRAERARVANELRSNGREAAERIRADADRQAAILLAEADRDAERLRGEGDAVSAATYAAAYEQDSEFYAFTRSLQAYQRAFSGREDLMVIDPDSEFFEYFRNRRPNATSGN